MARWPRNFYAGLSFRPPQPVAAAARRALERRAQQPPSNRGMTPVGLARARQLLNRQQLSPKTIDRMVSYFARHEVDKQGSSWGTYGKGRQAWNGWGGDPGRRWATAVAPADGCSGTHSRAFISSSPPTLTRNRVNPTTELDPKTLPDKRSTAQKGRN